MKTGIVRNIDELGRIMLPVELRRMIHMDVKDSMEFLEDDSNARVGLRKFHGENCFFCLESNQLTYFRKRFLCQKCVEQIIHTDD